MAFHPKICKHIHLPVQSGNDRILGLMNRSYTRRDYLALVEQIRSINPGIVLTTDIIAGFCSETEGNLQIPIACSKRFAIIPLHLRVFGTVNTIAARKFPDDVAAEVKSQRVTALVEMQRRISSERNREYIDMTLLPVLVEGDAKKSPLQAMGKTDGTSR